MALSQREMNEQGVPILFLQKGDLIVTDGTYSHFTDSATIPLDGRPYHCAGELVLRNGRRLRADFLIDTGKRHVLIRRSVWCSLDGDLWYKYSDPELPKALGASKSEIFPFRWQPDRPFEHPDSGPYSIYWSPKSRTRPHEEV